MSLLNDVSEPKINYERVRNLIFTWQHFVERRSRFLETKQTFGGHKYELEIN